MTGCSKLSISKQPRSGQVTPVIVSGGLASIEDIKALLAPRAQKLAGAVVGAVLYDAACTAESFGVRGARGIAAMFKVRVIPS